MWALGRIVCFSFRGAWGGGGRKKEGAHFNHHFAIAALYFQFYSNKGSVRLWLTSKRKRQILDILHILYFASVSGSLKILKVIDIRRHQWQFACIRVETDLTAQFVRKRREDAKGK